MYALLTQIQRHDFMSDVLSINLLFNNKEFYGSQYVYNFDKVVHGLERYLREVTSKKKNLFQSSRSGSVWIAPKSFYTTSPNHRHTSDGKCPYLTILWALCPYVWHSDGGVHPHLECYLLDTWRLRPITYWGDAWWHLLQNHLQIMAYWTSNECGKPPRFLPLSM